MSLELIVDKPEALAEALAVRFEAEARRALSARGRFAVALPGGSTAVAFFPRLSTVPVDWGGVDFFWGDERAVPPDDPESNFGVARRLWLDPARVPAERVHRMPADAPDLDAAASDYDRELTRVLGVSPRLDLALFGVGPDGHVCSLFPGHPVLAETTRTVVAVRDSPKPPPCRLTLTLPLLAAAGLVVVAALGDTKARPVHDALTSAGSPLPLALVLRQATQALVLLDPDAARLLPAAYTAR